MNTRCRHSRCLTVVAIAGVVPATLTAMIDPFGYMGSIEAGKPIFVSGLPEIVHAAVAMPTLLVVLSTIMLLLSCRIEFNANNRPVLATADAGETQDRGCHRAYWRLGPAMEFFVCAVGIAGISPFHHSNGLTNLPISISEGGSCV